MQADIDKCQRNGGNMVKAIVGANWGDEGKGKITDMLAEESDIIVRFQGGANAGHTIVNDFREEVMQDIPLSMNTVNSHFIFCHQAFSIIIQQVLLATALLLIFHTLSRN